MKLSATFSSDDDTFPSPPQLMSKYVAEQQRVKALQLRVAALEREKRPQRQHEQQKAPPRQVVRVTVRPGQHAPQLQMPRVTAPIFDSSPATLREQLRAEHARQRLEADRRTATLEDTISDEFISHLGATFQQGTIPWAKVPNSVIRMAFDAMAQRVRALHDFDPHHSRQLCIQICERAYRERVCMPPPGVWSVVPMDPWAQKTPIHFEGTDKCLQTMDVWNRSSETAMSRRVSNPPTIASVRPIHSRPQQSDVLLSPKTSPSTAQLLSSRLLDESNMAYDDDDDGAVFAGMSPEASPMMPPSPGSPPQRLVAPLPRKENAKVSKPRRPMARRSPKTASTNKRKQNRRPCPHRTASARPLASAMSMTRILANLYAQSLDLKQAQNSRHPGEVAVALRAPESSLPVDLNDAHAKYCQFSTQLRGPRSSKPKRSGQAS
ncbi:hypothetical protein BC940DRAFT_367984 [Gongronella butleri]|nr:hypothetical protein BC940DRAFT_367984 [Gongronella butleri]